MNVHKPVVGIVSSSLATLTYLDSSSSQPASFLPLPCLLLFSISFGESQIVAVPGYTPRCSEKNLRTEM